MTATKRFIEDMIEGGYYGEIIPKKATWTYSEKKETTNCGYLNISWHGSGACFKFMSDYEILLDLKAWQAVGKVRGWSEPQMLKSVYEDEGLKLEATGFFAQQLLFTAYLAEDKSIEEALQAIINKYGEQRKND